MLRFSAAVLLVVALCSGKPDDDETMKLMIKAHEDCGVTKEEMQDALKGKEDDKTKENALCLMTKFKIIDSNGEINAEAVKITFKPFLPKIADVGEKCIVNRDNAKDTAYAFMKCLDELYQKSNGN